MFEISLHFKIGYKNFGEGFKKLIAAIKPTICVLENPDYLPAF
jgi:hypothetical protein